MPLAPVRLWSLCGAFPFCSSFASRVLTKFLAQRLAARGQHQGTQWLLDGSFAGSLPHFVSKMGIPAKFLTNSMAYDPSLGCLAVVQRIVYTRKGGR